MTDENDGVQVITINGVKKEMSTDDSDSAPINAANTSYAYPDTQRDPFFAFIPKVAGWACGIVAGEANLVKGAIVGGPRWTKDFLAGTFTFYKEHPRILFDEVLSGFTVAIMQVPESIAFSFVAGVPPLSGLHATFWMATITGILGGKPGMISGAAGALAVVVADLTADNGVLDYLPMAERLNVLYMTMFVCGLFQIAFCVLRLAKLVRLIPETGMIGFMNGLAIIIFMAQLPAFMYCTDAPLFIECTVEQRQWLTFQDQPAELCLTLVHVAICMAIMKFFPLIPKIGRLLPASLVGLLVGTLLEHTLFRRVFDVATRTVSETAPMSGSPPKFDWPAIPNDSTTIQNVITFGLTLAAIGSVESVLTLQACNEITDTVPKIGDSNQELFAQGLANLVSGLFRAMGGDAMIGQSTINIMNGARHRVSSTMSGIFMLLFVIALSPFIELLPVATLTGVLFMVVLSTFQWKTFTILRYGRLSDSIAILLVTLIAVFFNLAVAIAVGIVFSALVHAWDSGAHVEADVTIKSMLVNGERVDEVKYCHIRGAVFFSSSRKFVNMFDVANDPELIVLDFKDALIIDHSAVAAIQGISSRFEKAGKKVLLTNLPVKSHGRLHRTGDHATLQDQITPARQLQDVKGSSAGVVVDEEAGEDGSQRGNIRRAASTESERRVDETNVGGRLASMEHFNVPVDSVEAELHRLNSDQGEVMVSSIHGGKF